MKREGPATLSEGSRRAVARWLFISLTGFAWTNEADAQSAQACPLMTAVLHEAHADIGALQKKLGPEFREVVTQERTLDDVAAFEVHTIHYPNQSRLAWRRIREQGGLVLVDEIRLRSTGIRLANGIAVGDSEEVVKKMLGPPWKTTSSELVYACDTVLLKIALDARRVASIRWQFSF